MDTAIYRQGDVLIRRVAKFSTAKLTEIPRENGAVVLAHGEATGHTHAIEAKEARLFRGEKPGVCYLLLDAPVDLIHQEHAPIALPAGHYEVIRQVEYTPEAIRNVAD
jgi:hypothetical protein